MPVAYVLRTVTLSMVLFGQGLAAGAAGLRYGPFTLRRPWAPEAFWPVVSTRPRVYRRYRNHYPPSTPLIGGTTEANAYGT